MINVFYNVNIENNIRFKYELISVKAVFHFL